MGNAPLNYYSSQLTRLPFSIQKTLLELMKTFAVLNGRTLNPVFVDYRNFETVLNVASLGNLNRQFVSLLRSEQDAERPIVGNPDVFEKLLGTDASLFKMRDGLVTNDSTNNLRTPGEMFASGTQSSSNFSTTKTAAPSDQQKIKKRAFPIIPFFVWVFNNHRVIIPGTNLALETVGTYLFGKRFASDENWWWIRTAAMTGVLSAIAGGSMHAGAEVSKLYAEIVASGKWPPGWPPMGG